MHPENQSPMDQFTAHLDRGWDLIGKGDLPGARLSAEKLLELDGDSPDAHHLLGYIHAAGGNVDEALRHYRQAIDLDEGFVEAMLHAAELLLNPIGDHQAAIRLIDDALDFVETPEETADALLLKVDAYLGRKDLKAASRTLDDLPDGPFENPQLLFLLGRAYFETGRLEEAEKHIEAAATHAGDNPDVQYYQGLILEKKGERQGATVAFLRARELELRLGEAPWALPVTHFERKVQEAIRKLPSALERTLEGALVVISDLPGAEVVADGVDPRHPVLINLSPPGPSAAVPSTATHVFVYQRNIERLVSGVLDIDDEITKVLIAELAHVFPEAAGSEAGNPTDPEEQPS
ncbi:MAG: tetratricopeptide repeat protein [Myxococcota bacterium]